MAILCKCLGGLIAFAACVLGGLVLGWRDGFRAAELSEMRKAFVLLKGEIQHARTPLCEAFESVAERADRPAAQFFADMAKRLAEKKGEGVAAIWGEALDNLRHTSRLTEEDRRNLDLLGRAFGYLDGATQAVGIDLAMSYMDEQVAILQEKSEKNARLYRSIGMMCGALVVIALL